MQARLGGELAQRGRPTGLSPTPGTPSGLAHSLHHRVPAGREVIFVAIDEGHPEIEEQVDEKGSRVLCQEDLGRRAGESPQSG